MRGETPERPDWVRAIDRGDAPWASEEANEPFDRDALLARAAAQQGREVSKVSNRYQAFDHPKFPVEPIVENLDRLVAALETEAELTPTGRLMTHRFLSRILEVRIQILSLLKSDPGLEAESIERPLVVAGAPRTGTTILYSLLAADPRHRAPLGWELLRPVPSPSADPDERAKDPRVRLADAELRRPQSVVSGIEAIHAYAGGKPKECLSAMSFALQSEEFTARYHVPSYAAWLEASDMRPAYEMHALVLKILQRRDAKTAWALKCPVHLHSLETLFEIYPDARVAITHRDPLRVLGSLTSLIANLRFAHSDRVDPEEIARAHHDRYRKSFAALVRLTRMESLPMAQIHHSQFSDFQKNPMGVIDGLYAQFELPLDSPSRSAIERVLDASPRHAKGEHRYALPKLDLSEAETRQSYAEYQDFFGVPNEDEARLEADDN